VVSVHFEQRVDGIEVLDPTGTPYDHPFLGGFDVPRPQFVDIDADGDLDLFVQERSGELIHFENVGDARSPRFVWRTDRFQDLDVGDWNRFADFDGDGDQDLLAEERFSYVRYFRNDGTPARPRFTLVPDSVRDDQGVPVFSDRQNIPSVADIDCDGVWDLFLGRVDGTVARYEMAGLDERRSPRWRFIEERFQGIEIVAQFGSMHGANSMAFADVDDDGDLDLFWGDFFEPSLLFIENTGSCRSPVLRGEPLPLPVLDTLSTSGYNAPALPDIDADGDLDLFVGVLGGAFNPNRTASENLLFYEKTERGFARRTGRYLNGIDLGSESLPAVTDWDEDGDLDLVVGNKIDPATLNTGRLYLFEGLGGGGAATRDGGSGPRYALTDTLTLLETYHPAPVFGDLDGDGDEDLLLGTWNRGVAYFRKDGPGAFTLADSQLVKLTRGSHATPALGDLDGDGDLDLIVGEASGELNYYRNQGGPHEPRFELVSDNFGGIDAGRRSVPALHDIDGDGDLDLLLGSEAGGLQVYRNDGLDPETGAPRFVADDTFSLPLHRYGTPVFVDLDGDGDEDVVAGGLSGGLVFFENRGRPAGR